MKENDRAEVNAGNASGAESIHGYSVSENEEITGVENNGVVSAHDLLGRLKKRTGKSAKCREPEPESIPEDGDDAAPAGKSLTPEEILQSVIDDGDDEFLELPSEAPEAAENEAVLSRAQGGIIGDDSSYDGDASADTDSVNTDDGQDTASDEPDSEASVDDVLAAEASGAPDSAADMSEGYAEFDDFDSDDGGDDTDAQLSVAFGMDEAEPGNAHEKNAFTEKLDKTASIIIPKIKETFFRDDEQEEFTSPNQIKPILNRYKRRYQGLLLRLFGGALLVILAFLIENLSAFGASLPNWMDASTYPVVYSMLGIQLLVLGAALTWKSIVSGFRAISRFELTPDSALSVVISLGMLYELAMCLLHLNSAPDGIRFYNLPIMILVLMTLVGEYMNLKREIYSFNIVASKKHKFAIESLDEEQATLETNAFAGFMPENASIFRISETEFVDGFFGRMKSVVSGQKIINILLPVSVIVSVLFFAWDLFIDHSLDRALAVVQYTLNFSVPFIVTITFSLPFFVASRIAYKNGSAIIGGSSLEEYCNTSSAITFEDKDVFPAGGVMVKSIKTYGESRIDYIIYNVASLFMKVGGPLAEVFESATRDLDHTEDVRLTKIVSGGLEAYVSGEHVYCGSVDFMAENGFEVPFDAEDEALLDEGTVSIMTLVIGGEVVAKLYIQYMLDRDFEVTLKSFAKLGVCVGIKTFDPNITDVMLNRKIRLSDYPIKVLRCRTIDDMALATEHTESGVVSKRSVKAMMQTYSLCQKVIRAMKSGLMLKVFSMAFAFMIVAFLLLIGEGASVNSWQVALYQLIWIIPTAIVSRIYVTKN